ncbi:MAG: DUF4445 domain-containing protein [Firmicutes bacterium]|nr:DUF4445 domain-containing protein [Bacillota bacterium]MBR3260899.1 DUF4445 domain-containing protein [Bacillota bacterium]
MRNEIVRISEQRAHEGAEKRFLNTCGIMPGGSKKHQRMLEQGLQVRESGIGGIDIRSLVSYYGPEVIRDGKVCPEDAVLECNYFSHIPREYVEGIYVYMLTVGECLFESEDKIMEFLFADIWSNSYVDAGIEALKEDFIIPDMKKRFPEKDFTLSEEFGPGYYGMFVGKTKEFAKILDAESIGITVKESGLMLPQKSCAGLLFVLNHELEKEPACMRCVGNSKGCDFCEINLRRKEGGNDVSVTFMPMNIEYKGNGYGTVLECASRVGVNIDGNCGGKGTCLKCRVHIRYADGREKYALACAVKPENGMVVTVPEVETTAKRKKKLVKLPDGFVPDKGEGLGVSVDIGTTTVVVMLWDLETGEMRDIDAFTNPQGTWGADVISRIQYTIENEKGLEVLHKSVIKAINKAVDGFIEGSSYEYQDIKKYVVVGNTTMSHLFLGIDPRSLAVSPFKPQFEGPVTKKAKDLDLPGNDDAELRLVPNIAGHVGSDITAGLIATDILDKDKGHLFIDIGTNGEIVFSGNGKIATCSTAAGPAFEGSSIAQGMRAASGAIERVDLSDEGVSIKVIGDCKPIGICGSGIIDAIGEMVRTGVVDKTGKLLAPERLEKKGVAPKIIENVGKNEDGYYLTLYKDPEGEDIRITQKDVREIQLAKAAIKAGEETLMNAVGIGIDGLEKVSIAGAFGSYIRKESAVNCGLIPDIDHEKIFSIGNSAGIGASMALLSEAAYQETVHAAETIEHIELATRSDFQEKYMMAMRF